MRVVERPDEIDAHRGGRVGLVPTMGYLHEGHLSLLAEARRRCDMVVMSLFVNPLQFDRPADLDRYPRDLDRDAALAERADVDVMWAPPLQVMFPETPLTTVSVGEITSAMEGEHRPGHFAGVATVVAKLFAAVAPHVAFFGRKDHQQLAMVRRMATDLSFPVEVAGCPIVREADGLALSSRNMFIPDRRRALSISRGLRAAAGAVDAGERSGERLADVVRADLDLDSVDYVQLASQGRAEPIRRLDRPAFLAVAGSVGDVRLIDNVPIDLVGEMWVPDLGIMLEGASELVGR